MRARATVLARFSFSTSALRAFKGKSLSVFIKAKESLRLENAIQDSMNKTHILTLIDKIRVFCFDYVRLVVYEYRG